MKANTILETIGNTPHIRVQKLFPGSEVWVKSERSNPGGSIKDRIALAMIEAAERDGSLQPGGRRPSRSAASIIAVAIRSLIEPPGFWFSSLTKSSHGPVSRRVSRTSGVLPIRSSKVVADMACGRRFSSD